MSGTQSRESTMTASGSSRAEKRLISQADEQRGSEHGDDEQLRLVPLLNEDHAQAGDVDQRDADRNQRR